MPQIHRQLKYGRIERERRFLLAQVPDLPFDRRYDIVDRYIIGTRLRLRHMTDSAGDVDYKLARKLVPHEPDALVMGNLYLDLSEFTLLSSLPANVLQKRRLYLGDWGIDVFGGPLEGLILAEIEEDDPEVLASLTPPFPVVRDVTEEPAYCGGHLCTLTAAP